MSLFTLLIITIFISFITFSSEITSSEVTYEEIIVNEQEFEVEETTYEEEVSKTLALTSCGEGGCYLSELDGYKECEYLLIPDAGSEPNYIRFTINNELYCTYTPSSNCNSYYGDGGDLGYSCYEFYENESEGYTKPPWYTGQGTYYISESEQYTI